MKAFDRPKPQYTLDAEKNMELFNQSWAAHIQDGAARLFTALLTGQSVKDELGCTFNAYVPLEQFPVGIPRGKETAALLAAHITARYQGFGTNAEIA